MMVSPPRIVLASIWRCNHPAGNRACGIPHFGQSTSYSLSRLMPRASTGDREKPERTIPTRCFNTTNADGKLKSALRLGCA
jgi:hypothetical protein